MSRFALKRLKSIDPLGIEQVRIEVQGIDEHDTRVVASAKNLEAFGGGAPMVYVRAYVDVCARACENHGMGSIE